MNAKITWNQKMSFDGTADTGFVLPLDADPGVGGEDGGFRPLELLLVGLAGCTAMDVISILRKKRQDVTEFEVTVHAERPDTHPKVFTEVTVEYKITGKDVDEAAAKRAIELSETKYCPAHAMLSKSVQMSSSYSILEV